ncbi:MAG: triacylglycerol lipase [Lachnospiraceae bacterium]|nr:triacylglycerol lipase [Lachnospiraceae bacterium]
MKFKGQPRMIFDAVFFAIITFIVANIYIIKEFHETPLEKAVIVLIAICYLLMIIRPSLFIMKLDSKILTLCYGGCTLLTGFLISSVMSIFYSLFIMVRDVPFHPGIRVSPLYFGLHILVAVLVEASFFWAGIIRVYLSSTQIRIKWRVIGAIFGMVPVVNLFILFHILRLAYAEVVFEDKKLELNYSRVKEQICKTKYPLLLVHGVFFRDSKLLNYWGRVPEELEKNGATVYYGNQDSALSVCESAKDLADRIRQVLRKTGAEKVNIIAHSKGGLDSRYAISMLGMDDKVASLTTINTPHRGCEFADYLLSVIPKSKQIKIEKAYNVALKKLGDEHPDFMSAVNDLTASKCAKRNEEVIDSKNVYYQSVGSCLRKPESGRFPLNMTHSFVKYFDGRNDGLVGEKSFEWGEKYTLLENETHKRGISHADMIDLNRENIPGFDVREFYVNLVADLKERGF